MGRACLVGLRGTHMAEVEAVKRETWEKRSELGDWGHLSAI